MAKKSDIEKELIRQGFNATVDNDGKLTLEPSHLQLTQINVLLVKRGRYITDPALVPPELQDKNILWVQEPPVVSAITKSGEEIPVYVEQVITEFKTVHPEDN